MESRFRLFLATLSIFALAPAHADAQEVVWVVRHAEQVKDMEDPPLTEEGQSRARALADFLRDSRITGVYSSQARRTIETARPTAESVSVEVRQVPREHTDELVARIRAEEPEGRVLVVGHSETLPGILEALGHPEKIAIDKSDYDNIFVVVPDDGPTPLVLRHRLRAVAPCD